MRITFKKINENHHGQIVAVFDDNFCVGTIKKWHGLFIAIDHHGEKQIIPHDTRKEAAEFLVSRHKFETA